MFFTRKVSNIQRDIRILFLLCLSCLFTGCAEHEIRMEMKRFAESRIELPEGLQSVIGRNVVCAGSLDGKPSLVVYNDSSECSSCRINHLQDMISIYRLSDTLDFQVLTIFSPREDEYDNVIRELVILDFPYPVYVDFSGSFRKKNPGIPEDKRFHSFLLDREGHPVFVGNPVAGDRLWSLFNEALGRLSENDVQ